MTKQNILETINIKEEDIFNSIKYDIIKEKLLCLAIMNEDLNTMSRILSRYTEYINILHT